MKNSIKLIAVVFLTIFYTSCSKDNDSPAVITKEKTVEDIEVSVSKVATPIAPKIGYPGYLSRSWFQLIGNNIIYTCASNLGASNPQFMLKYTITSNTFATVTPNDVACACGYMNSFVTDNTNAFMIANDARKFTMSNNTWSDIDFPATIRDNIGEAGMVYANGKIYVCGGRTASRRFVSYNVSSNGWLNENYYSENITSSEMTTVQNRIYLLGGNATGKNFSYFDIATNKWVSKANLNFTMPIDYSTNTVTSLKNRYIFALKNDKIYAYDTEKDQWKTEPITISVSGSAKHLFTQNDNTLLVTSVSDTGDFALYKLTITLP